MQERSTALVHRAVGSMPPRWSLACRSRLKFQDKEANFNDETELRCRTKVVKGRLVDKRGWAGVVRKIGVQPRSLFRPGSGVRSTVAVRVLSVDATRRVAHLLYLPSFFIAK